MMDDTSDEETCEVSFETVEVAWRELQMLIESTADEEPDPLQDDVFRARNELRDAIDAYEQGAQNLANIELNEGEVYRTGEGPVQIISLSGSTVTVTDPLVNHPQDSRYGTWDIDVYEFMGWIRDEGVEQVELTLTDGE